MNNSNFTNAVELFYTSDLVIVDSVDFTLFIPSVGVKEVDFSQFIQIYPNPAADKITVQLPEQFNNSVQITLSDICGRVLKSVANQNEISVSELAAGMYFVKIESEGKIIRKKFVKNKLYLIILTIL
jgi:hypothetical protein